MFIEQHAMRRPALVGLMALAVILNFCLWTATHRMQPLWPNVPPAPTAISAAFTGLGDRQLAYRLLSFPLQQMGNEGGRITPLKEYNYDRLGEWFHALYGLDDQSSYTPYLASYYFGATQDPERQLGPVIDYLAMVGRGEGHRKWYWMSQAVYLAHYKKKDYTLASALANEMAVLPGDLPHWARQMPAILAAERGDKETALRLFRTILMDMVNDKVKTPDPTEVNFLVNFICRRLQTKSEAAADPVCQATGK